MTYRNALKSEKILHVSNEYEINEEKPDHHFRTEIPNIIFELNLSPAVFCVYANLKRIAGDGGSCFKSNKNLAKECGMSERSLIDCIKELAELPILIGKDPLPGKQEKFHDEIRLIKITSRKKEDGSCDTNLITITPIWRLNGDVMRSKIKKNCGGAKNVGGVVQNLQGGGAGFADKEEPVKKNDFNKELKYRYSKSPSQKNKEIVKEIDSFDPFTYVLRNGQTLKKITAGSYRKKMKDPYLREKILSNIRWYENQIDSGVIPKKSHEAFLQFAITNDMASKGNSSSNNEIFAKIMQQEHNLDRMKIMKTVVQLYRRDGVLWESVNKNLPEETFGKIIEEYAKKYNAN